MNHKALIALATIITSPSAALAEAMSLEEAVAEIRRQAAEMKILKEKIEKLESQRTEPALTAKEPQEKSKSEFDIAARITFLKPTLNDFDLYGGVNVAENFYNDGTRITTTDLDLKSLEYGYNTGYEIISSYKFANTGWGLGFKYAELNASIYASSNTNAAPDSPNGLGGGRINTLHSVEIDDPDTDTIYGDSTLYTQNLKLGGTYELALNKSVNFLIDAGFQSGQIDASIVSRDEGEFDRDSASTSDGRTGNFDEYSTVVSNFDGWGPYVGAGFDFSLFSGLRLSLGGNAGVLVGNSTSKIQDFDRSKNSATTLPFEWNDSDFRSVPTYGLNVAVAYQADLSKSLSLIFDGGYEFNGYVGGLNSSFTNMIDAMDAGKFGSSSDLTLAGWKIGAGLRYQF